MIHVQTFVMGASWVLCHHEVRSNIRVLTRLSCVPRFLEYMINANDLASCRLRIASFGVKVLLYCLSTGESLDYRMGAFLSVIEVHSSGAL